MPYVDGFVIPVPKAKVSAYRRIAKKASKIWIDHGALEYRECVGDDLNIKGVASFREATQAKRNETVIFAWIVYRSKLQRDRVNEKVMKDPRLANMKPESMPFDVKRMVCGGFKVLVEASIGGK